MADKKYKLNIEMTDGSTRSVEFTSPQGPQGEQGPKGENDVFAFTFRNGDAGGVMPADIYAAIEAGKACAAIDPIMNRVYYYRGKEPFNEDKTKTVPTFVQPFCVDVGENKMNYRILQMDDTGKTYNFLHEDARLANPEKLIFNGAVEDEYDGSEKKTITIPEVPEKYIVSMRIVDGEYLVDHSAIEIWAAHQEGKEIEIRHSITDSGFGVAEISDISRYTCRFYIYKGIINVDGADRVVFNEYSLQDYDLIPKESKTVRLLSDGDRTQLEKMISGSGSGNGDIFIAKSDTIPSEIRAAANAGKVCVYVDRGVVYTYDGESEYDSPTFRATVIADVAKGTLTERYAVLDSEGWHTYSLGGRKFVNPQALTINGTKYDGSKAVNLTIEGGTGGSGLPSPEGPNLALVTDADGNWTQVERLGYPITGTVTILDRVPVAQAEIDGGVYYLLFTTPLNGKVEAGKTYNVDLFGYKFSGTAKAHNVEAFGGLPFIFIGNAALVGGEDTGEPLFVMFIPDAAVQEMGGTVMAGITDPSIIDADAEEYLTITGEGTTCKKISFDYLPEGVGGVDVGVVLPEVTLTASEELDGAMLIVDSFNTPIVGGGQYTVLWNGSEYKCVAHELSEDGVTLILTGNVDVMMGGAGTGEPFVIMTMPGGIGENGAYGNVIPLDGSTTATLSISGETIRKIPKMYLDLGVSSDGASIVLTPDDTGAKFTASVDFETAFSMSINDLQKAIRIESTNGYYGMAVYAVSKYGLTGNGGMRAIQMVCMNFNDYERFETPILQWWAGSNIVVKYSTRSLMPKNENTNEKAIPVIDEGSGWSYAQPLTYVKELLGVAPLVVKIEVPVNALNSNTFVADHYSADIIAAHQAGRRIYAVMGDMLLNLAQVVENSNYCIFSVAAVDNNLGPFIMQIKVSADAVERTITMLSINS